MFGNGKEEVMTSEVPEHLMMSAYLKAAAFDAMRAQPLSFDGDFLDQVGKFIDAGVSRLAFEAEGTSIWTDVELVQNNLSEFIYKVIADAREVDKREVNSQSFMAAYAGFCPRWP
ncbi:hypothetical protein ABZV25_14830, partial [Micrococcus luteus]